MSTTCDVVWYQYIIVSVVMHHNVSIDTDIAQLQRSHAEPICFLKSYCNVGAFLAYCTQNAITDFSIIQ